MSRVIFITGTDTGCGKTLLTALLLAHLRGTGKRALAMKPVACGGDEDARLLSAVQGGVLSAELLNPYRFEQPVTPWLAARQEGRRLTLAGLCRRINLVKDHAEFLLVEGCGGLLAPFGAALSAREMIVELQCDVIVASRNRLGTLNHTILTVEALAAAGVKKPVVVLMGAGKKDRSCSSNALVLKELLPRIGIVGIPYLGPRAGRLGAVLRAAKECAKNFKKTLALLEGDR